MLNGINQFIKNDDEIKEEENKATNNQDSSAQDGNAGGSVENGTDEVQDNVTTDEDLDRVLGSNQNTDSNTENNDDEVGGGDENGETLTPGQQEGSNNVGDEGQVDVDETIADESQQNKNVEKMIAQSKVNDIAAKARQEGRDSAIKELLMKYGVNSSDELDDLFGKGQSFVDLDNEYNMQGESYRNALAENALLKSRIDLNRWEDVKLILGGKGLEITPENIEAHIVNHPEWRTMETGGDAMNGTGKVLTPEMGEQLSKGITVDNNSNMFKQPATLRKLGNEASPTDTKMSEEELAKKLYDLRWNK
jgi:hypothetical protein